MEQLAHESIKLFIESIVGRAVPWFVIHNDCEDAFLFLNTNQRAAIKAGLQILGIHVYTCRTTILEATRELYVPRGNTQIRVGIGTVDKILFVSMWSLEDFL